MRDVDFPTAILNTKVMRQRAMPAGRRGFAPIIILFLIAILGAVGYFAYTKGYLNQFISKNVMQKNITPASYPINTKPPSTPGPTAGWTIYKEPTGIYSISFPTYFSEKVYPRGTSQYLSISYKEEPTPPVSKFSAENALYIEIYLNKDDKNKTAEEIAITDLENSKLFPNRNETSELTESTFANRKSYQYTSNNGQDYHKNIFMGLDNSYTLQISYLLRGSESFREKYLQVAEQIFSTFKFTK